MTKNTADDELEAIRQMLGALEPLDREARTRTVEYVFRRLGITTPESSQEGTGEEHADVLPFKNSSVTRRRLQKPGHTCGGGR